jgi:hypothetical protein
LFELKGDVNASDVARLAEFFLPGNMSLAMFLEENGHRLKIDCTSRYGLAMEAIDRFLDGGGECPTLILQ